MRQDKDLIFKLRRNGKTYRQIQKEFDISRSTLCEWFKNEEWSKHIKNKNNLKNIKISKNRILSLNKAREEKLLDYYKRAETEAVEEYEYYKNNPLFIAGLMLYAGEGDHLSKNFIKFANVDFGLHKIFLSFSRKFFKLNNDSIKFSILLYPDLKIESCVDKWVTELGIHRKNIYKPQVIIGKLKARRLHFGVGTSIILNSFLKKKLLVWIEISKLKLIKAVID